MSTATTVAGAGAGALAGGLVKGKMGAVLGGVAGGVLGYAAGDMAVDAATKLLEPAGGPETGTTDEPAPLQLAGPEQATVEIVEDDPVTGAVVIPIPLYNDGKPYNDGKQTWTWDGARLLWIGSNRSRNGQYSTKPDPSLRDEETLAKVTASQKAAGAAYSASGASNPGSRTPSPMVSLPGSRTVHPGEAVVPNEELGTHRAGDPYGSFRAVNVGDYRTADMVASGLRKVAAFFGISTKEMKAPAPVLFVDPKWATAGQYYQLTVYGDTGAGVGVEVWNGTKDRYNGVAGVNGGGKLLEARGRELYGNLEAAAKRGAYFANVDGQPVLSYRSEQWR